MWNTVSSPPRRGLLNESKIWNLFLFSLPTRLLLFSFQIPYIRAPNECPTIQQQYQIYHITIRNLSIASDPSFFLKFTRGSWKKILMDSHPYSYETSIFILGMIHEEVQGRQTKLHPGFTLGKLVQPSPGISILGNSRALFCPNGLNDVLQNFLIA